MRDSFLGATSANGLSLSGTRAEWKDAAGELEREPAGEWNAAGPEPTTDGRFVAGPEPTTDGRFVAGPEPTTDDRFVAGPGPTTDDVCKVLRRRSQAGGSRSTAGPSRTGSGLFGGPDQ